MEEQDLYDKQVNEGLQKHLSRNNAFLEKYGNWATYDWMCNYMKNLKQEYTRAEMGDEKFNAHLSTLGLYNSIMGLLAKDAFDEDKLVQKFMRVTAQKLILA